MNDERADALSSDTTPKTADDQLDIQIAKLESTLRYRPRWGGPMGILLFLIAISGIAYAIFGRSLVVDIVSEEIIKYTPLIGLGIFFYGAFMMAYLSILWNSRTRQLYQELEVLRARKRALVNPADPATPLPYFDRLVNINISNLEAYYTLVKVHTNNSFLASMYAGAIGFLLITTGLIVGFTDFTNSRIIAYISAGSGVITEFIAGVFFYLYNSTTRQLKEYHDSLIDVQNVLLSFKIVEDTSDKETRAAMTKAMIESLIKSKQMAGIHS